MRKRFSAIFSVAAMLGMLALTTAPALAGHPKVDLDNDGVAAENIPLFTFEEIATQYGVSQMPVVIPDTDTMRGMPYSLKQTCGNCHDYDNINKHAFHANLGMYQWDDTDGDPNTAGAQLVGDQPKPWVQGGGMYGKWCVPSLRQQANLKDQDPNTAGVQDLSYTESDFLDQIDLAAWDMATFCGSCHVGGGFMEHDRNGTRLSMRALTDTTYNAYSSYVQESYDAYGALTSSVARAPYIYPVWNDTDGDGAADTPETAPNGYGLAVMSSAQMPVVDGQLMMPNVKEMDCLMCHFQGFNNLMSSVMTYSGALNVVSMAGSGIMDINQLSPTYQGYNGSLITVDPTTHVVSLSDAAMARIEGNPLDQNCKGCHMPGHLVDLPDMMRDFLSSAPMEYDAATIAAGQSFTGLKMPSYDFNAPFAYTYEWSQGPYSTSPIITVNDVMYDLTTPGSTFAYIEKIGFPSAMGTTGMNTLAAGDVGGGNPAGTGPLYFAASQSSLKMAVVPFPRAEWFKRGDIWGQLGDDVHFSMGCKACHFDTNTLKVDGAVGLAEGAGVVIVDGKSMCDPGRGFDRMSGIEAGQASDLGSGVTDSRNTVKRCENCHVTGTNDDGVAIETYGAPNAVLKHEQAGLNAKVTRAIKLDAAGNTVEVPGSHIDLMDCSVCHVYKKQTVVRSLDATSGNRFPNMVGFDTQKGMLGLFDNPAPGMFPDGNTMEEWTPVYGWAKAGDAPKRINGVVNPNWTRKIYALNPIVSCIWDNVGAGDMNHDGYTGNRPTDGENYYDPAIMRDLKAGMNFGPSGFGPVPVGFGATPEYASIYNANGTFASGTNWEYVGVYGGNVVFNTPEQIAAYKTFRGWNDPADIDVQLTWIAVPFMVTHNVKGTKQFVRGKSCDDCHSAGAGFFDGGVNMVGTAIKVVEGGNFMQQPAVDLPVMAYDGDLLTGTELGTVYGGNSEIDFQADVSCADPSVAWDGSTAADHCVKIVPMERAEALYEHGTSVDGSGAYVGVDDTVYADRAAWISYLETPKTLADSGIGIDPTASIATINTVDLDSVVDSDGDGLIADEFGIKVGSNVTLLAADQLAGFKGSVTYYWFINDGLGANGTTGSPSTYFTGQSVDHLFAKKGTWTVTLKVIDEEGSVAQTYQKVNVEAAASTITVGLTADGGAGNTSTVTFDSLPAGTDTLYILWGDGSKEKYEAGADITTVVLDHVFSNNSQFQVSAGVYVYKLSVYAFDGGSRLMSKGLEITIDGL